MLDQPVICTTVPKVPRGPWLGELSQRKIWLSDVGSGCPDIEILIGADLAGRLVTGRIRHLKSGLVAVETKLGWTLMGEVPGGRRRDVHALVATSLLNSDACISNLWKLDTLGITDPTEATSRKQLEEAAKQHFLETVSINAEGRYEVHLPWLDGHPPLPSNMEIAKKRLATATSKLVASGHLEDYAKVFQEWLDMGIIERVPESELSIFGHYLPHRAVIKTSSATTKVRPVFDASAHEKGKPCLNDCLEKGPNLIEKLLHLVLRFRLKRIGVASDIFKAFLMLSLALRDRDFLRFLWWEDYITKKMVVLRHKRDVFGVSSSPFQLAAAIELHLDRAPVEFKEVAEQLKKAFYVDNVATSVDSHNDLLVFKQGAQDLMDLGKFDLRGWEYTLSNPEDAKGEDTEVLLLGLRWDKRLDTLRCEVVGYASEGPVTKRKILSVSHKVFDPIGFTCPVTLFPKQLLQQTWDAKTGWDTDLPEEISEKFQKWAVDLPLLAKVCIPRWRFGESTHRRNWTIHTFSDASKLAYAACVFIRAEWGQGVSVQLVLAKSRVAPIKSVTIPRLELLSCLIGVRLTEIVKKSLDMADVQTFYWSDSSTALSWISRDDQWGTFIGNRVKEIRSTTTVSDWRHVPGTMNPADLPSRGCSAKLLLESKWWEGPAWLRLPEDQWPNSVPVPNEEEVTVERRKTVVPMFDFGVRWNDISNYFVDVSGYAKVVRRIAWYRRYFAWLMRKVVSKDRLTVLEMDNAEVALLKSVQEEAFGKSPEDYVSGTEVFVGEDGLYRVKTRLVEGDVLANFKFPILLPSADPIVTNLVREVHLENCHAGVQILLAILRERFWIVRARKTVRAIVSRCIRCCRFSAKKIEAVPGPLPKDRIRQAATFEVTGVDLAGPLYLRGGQKGWIVLFTCAVYRALHLELVTSLSTDAFIMALRRFIARRGRPSTMYSDNGTNFLGTENLFRRLDWNVIQNYAKRIQWKFNPPSAAWWGGWWERLVRMVKDLLRRNLGKACLSYEELETILCDCEAVINSRPLTYVSEDVKDFHPISPAVFLQDVQETGVPDMNAIDHLALKRRKRFLQKLREQLRKRFEYLGQLVQRSGAKGKCHRIALGDIVLVGSDNAKRLEWPLAKVVELLPGKDGNIRLVRVKTAVGEFLRPVQRLYPLEVTAAEESEPIPLPIVLPEPVSGLSNPVPIPGDITTLEPDMPKEVAVKNLVTRSGRVVKTPVKFTATYMTLFAGSEN